MVVNLIPIQCLFEGLILNDQVNYIYLFVTEVGQMSQSCVGEGRVSKVNKAKKKKISMENMLMELVSGENKIIKVLLFGHEVVTENLPPPRFYPRYLQ